MKEFDCMYIDDDLCAHEKALKYTDEQRKCLIKSRVLVNCIHYEEEIDNDKESDTEKL